MAKPSMGGSTFCRRTSMQVIRALSLNVEFLRAGSKLLARIQAFSSVLFIDSCESGSIIEAVEEQKSAFALLAKSNRNVITATTSVQRAAEGIGGHGLFTYSLLSGFGEGAPTAMRSP
jgi:hypothetical protein